MRADRWWCVAPLLTLLVLAPGCGFSGKKEAADKIRSAPVRLGSGRPQTVQLRVTSRQIGTLAASPTTQAAQASAPARPSGLTTQGSLDYATRRAVLTVAAPTGVEPFQIFDGTSLYQRRLGGSSTQRPWLRLDLVDLYPDRQAQEGVGVGAQLITPVMVVDMLRGTLSGSVRDDGRDTIGDTPMARYKINVDLEKAMDGASEPARRSFEAVRAITGIKRLVQPGLAWLDDRGSIRRVQITLREERSRDEGADVTLVMDLADTGSPLTITLPPSEQVSVVRDIQSLVAAVRPGSDR